MNSSTLPKITLVTPCLNQASQLEATIETVLSQQYPSLQYVIVDGGSTDGSADIIRRYEDRLLFLQNDFKGGCSEALNEVFFKTDGDIMGWLPVNEFLLPNTLNKLAYLFARNQGADWLSGLHAIRDEKNNVNHVEHQQCRLSLEYFQQGLSAGAFMQPISSTFWRRAFWEKTQARLDARFNLAADLSLWSGFVRYSDPMSVKSLLSSVSSQAGQMSRRRDPRYKSELSQIVCEVQEFEDSGRDNGERRNHGFEVEFDFCEFNKFCAVNGLAKTPVEQYPIHKTQLEGILEVADRLFLEGPAWLAQLLAHEAADGFNPGHDTLWFPASIPKIGNYHFRGALEQEVRFETLQSKIPDNLTQPQIEALLNAYDSEVDCVRKCHVKALNYAKVLRASGREYEAREFFINSLKLNNVYGKALELAPDFLGPVAYGEVIRAAKRSDPRVGSNDKSITCKERLTAKARSFLRDVRLEAVYKSLSNGAFEVLSVDFFDTLVGRFTRQPKDVFHLVAQRLKSLGLLRDFCTESAFATLREEAELRTRIDLHEKSMSLECRLDEIYGFLSGFVGDVSKAIEVEIEMERTLCFLNPGVAALVDWFLEMGGRVVVASDMYLPENALRDILSSNGYDASRFERIFVSSHYRKSKHAGDLFDQIMSECNVSAAQICHIGDNWVADVEVPRRKGIKAFHLPLSDSLNDTTLNREKFISNLTSGISLNSFRFIARNQHGHVGPNENEAYQVGKYSIGPALTLYVDWVVRSCRERNITHALCLMREGQLLSTMLQRAAFHDGYPLTADRLYVSRSALRMPSLGKPTFEKILERLSKRGSLSFGDACQIFKLPPGLVSASSADLDAPVDLHRLARLIANEPELVAILERTSARERRLAVNYLRSVIGGSTRVALVDLGFRATIQHYLTQSLRLDGDDLDIDGLYFASAPGISSRLMQGYRIDSFFDANQPEFAKIRSVVAHPEILEQTVSSTFEGTTTGYSMGVEGKVQPVLEDVRFSAADLRTRISVQRGILDFQKLWLSALRSNSRFSTMIKQECMEDLRSEAFVMICRLFTMPTLMEAQVLGGLSHDDNNGFDSLNRICPVSSRHMARTGDFDAVLRSHAYWPNGVIGMAKQEFFDKIIRYTDLIERN